MRVLLITILLASTFIVSCGAKGDTYGRQHQQADKAFGELK